MRTSSHWTSVGVQTCTADNSDYDLYFQKHSGSLESNHDHPITQLRKKEP